jgi:hypothetical protein
MDTIRSIAEELQEQVIKLIKENTTGSVNYTGQWRRGNKLYYTRTAEGKKLKENVTHRIHELSSYQELVSAIEKDSQYGKKINKSHYIHSGGSDNTTPEGYIDLCLINMGELLSLKRYNKKTALKRFLDELIRTKYTIRYITPIFGLKVKSKVRLDGEFYIVPENPKDIIACLNMGLIAPDFPVGNDFWRSGLDAGLAFLVSEVEHPVISGRELNQKERRISISALESHEWRASTLQMTFDLNSYEINVGKTLITHNYLAQPGAGVHNWERLEHVRYFSRGLVLNRNLTKHLRIVYDVLNNENIATNKMLRLACDRLATARLRKDEYDSFLDLMIACEAFYLSEKSDHMDINYRLRLRAAYWTSSKEFSKSEVMKLFSLAYSVRSSIAHGSIPEKMKFREKDITVKELFENIERIIKLGIIIFMIRIDKLGNNYRLEWEKIVLNEAK